MSIFRKKATYCCSTFEGHYWEAGKGTGFGLVVTTNSQGVPVVKIQHRAVDRNSHEIKLPAGTRLALLSEMGILYCPWCGRDLRRYYCDSAAQLARPEIESPEY